MAFVLVLVLILFFGFFTDWIGRMVFEQKIPATLTEAAIVQAMGQPDKRCVDSPECIDFLDAFIFKKPRPSFTEFFAYTDHYPLLPVLVFFVDEDGNILGYDYGKG